MTLTWKDFYLPPINLWSAPKMKDSYYNNLQEKMMTEEEWDALNSHPNINGIDPLDIPALNKQIGGDHYKDMEIQPVEFISRNKIPFIEGNVIKYVCRHKRKNGKKDLEKARHFIDLLIELEYK